MSNAPAGSGSTGDPQKPHARKQTQPAGRAPSSAPLEDGRQQRVAEKRKEAEQFLSRDDFDSALPILKKLAALTHESDRETATWARRQIQIATRRASQSQEQTAAVCRLARQLIDQRDYTGAVKVLADVSAIEATDESRELLEEAREIVSELSVLAGEIESAMDSKRYEDARPLVARYLKLKPKDRKVREISERLNSYGGRGAMTAGLAKDRSVGKGEGFGVSGALIMTLVVGVIAFGVGYAIISSHLKNDVQTIAVAIDSAVPAPDLGFDVAGTRTEASSLGAGLKLKPGRHTVRLLRGPSELSNADIVVEAKSQNLSLRVEMRNGVAVLLVIPAGQIPAPAVAQSERTAPGINNPSTPNGSSVANPLPSAPSNRRRLPPGSGTSNQIVNDPGEQTYDIADTELAKKLFAKRNSGVILTIELHDGNQNQMKSAHSAADMPNQPIRVTQVLFTLAKPPFDKSDLELVKGFPKLKGITLGGGDWDGSELQILSGNTTIDDIAINGNLATPPPSSLPPCQAFSHLSNFKNLKRLSIQGLSVSDADLKLLEGFPELQSLQIYADALSSQGLQSIRKLSNLSGLSLLWHDLDATGFKDQDAEILRDMSNLDGLTLGAAKEFTGAGFESLPTMPSLRFFSVGSALRFGDRGVAALAKLAPNLQGVQLNSRQGRPLGPTETSPITDNAFAALGTLNRLQQVTIQKASGITGTQSARLSNLSGFRSLGLSGCGVSLDGIKAIASCKNLKVLSLSEMPLGDEVCADLAAMSNLENVSLSFTQITDTGLARFSSATNLRQLTAIGSKVTRDRVARLKQARPNLNVMGP